MYRISAIVNSEPFYEKYSLLLAKVFENDKLYKPSYLQWQYGHNPTGHAVGFNAWDGEELAGHYAALPIAIEYNNERVLGLLSLNTATHPDHQGKGLFTKLGAATYDWAVSNGYQFVIGVANANSTPGFIKKFNFKLLTPLEVFVGVGHIQPDRARANFKIERSPDFIKWRLARPDAHYSKNTQTDKTALYSRTHLPFVLAQLTNYERDLYRQPKLPDTSLLHSTLWIGYNQSKKKNGIFVPLPNKLKTSPLNLILKGLTDSFKMPNLNEIDFGLIDFDAY